MSRYQRQILLPEIGESGQAKLALARVLIIGCGALGTHLAEQLARAGVGRLRLADRDLVELSNLQRQVLFDEKHARDGWPKAIAAAEKISEINSQIDVESLAVDVHSGNIESLIHDSRRAVDLILDGTDNVSTRYLINDVAVKLGIPWIYGACVGTEGRMMAILPGQSPCLRCIFPNPPRADQLPTCDTAGVLGTAAAMVAAFQATAAIKVLTGQRDQLSHDLVSFDLWSGRFHSMDLKDGRRPDCRCCGLREFEFLLNEEPASAISLCGRDAVQVRGTAVIDLREFADRWRVLGEVEQNPFFIKLHLTEFAGMRLTLFADARLIVQGTRDPARAKSIYARYVGA